MAEIVNLRRARKARERDERDRKAAENRVAYGRTKAERRSAAAERAKDGRAAAGGLLDPARQGTPAPGDPDDKAD